MLINEDSIRVISTLEQDTQNISLGNKLIKLSEEVGELSAAYLDHMNLPTKSASSVDSSLLEELCDVMNVTYDLVFKCIYDNVFTEKQFKEMFEKKLKKWERKLHGWYPGSLTYFVKNNYCVIDCPYKMKMQYIDLPIKVGSLECGDCQQFESNLIRNLENGDGYGVVICSLKKKQDSE